MQRLNSRGAEAVIALTTLALAAPESPAQDIPVSRLRFDIRLLDELGQPASAGPCGVWHASPEQTIGGGPLEKFATSQDGDIAGWRVGFDPSVSLPTPKMPMVWMREPGTVPQWTPVRLPILNAGSSPASLAAAATGCVRMRVAPGAAPRDELFVAGWQETTPFERTRPMLWRVRRVDGAWIPEIIDIEPFYTPDPGDPPDPPKVFWPSARSGSAWATGAIEIAFAPGPDGALIPWLAVYAAQGFQCRTIDGGAGTDIYSGVAPMRLVVEAETLRLNTVPPATEFPIPWTLTERFVQTLSGGLPVAIDSCPDLPDFALWAARIPRAMTVRADGTMDIVRTGRFWNTSVDSCDFQIGSFVVGPFAGSKVRDTVSGVDPAVGPDIHLLGSATGTSESVFPQVLASANAQVRGTRAMEIDLVCPNECVDPQSGASALRMPRISDMLEAAALPADPASLHSAGWRRRPQFIRHFEPMVWLPGATPILIEDTCALLQYQSPHAPTVMLPPPPDNCGTPYAGAWALGVEHVRHGASTVPEVVGASCHGPLWWNGAAEWSLEVLMDDDASASAHSITPDGEIVIVGSDACGDPGNLGLNLGLIRVVKRSVPGDIDGNGRVDAADISVLLASWGFPHPFADLDGDGTVNAPDLSILLSSWTQS